jgi:SAM-dependent methyltransferase
MPADDYFDDAIAERYDDDVSDAFDPAVVGPTVDVLVDLAAGGRALEFGVGTGRIALPLAGRGVPVHGIDLSPAMIRRLKEKPGADRVSTTIGDFATARAPGEFSLIYLVFNTIMNITSQAGQVACFRNAARHLVPGGRFVVEVMVPELRRLPPGERVRPFRLADDSIGFDEYDTATQTLVSHHIRFDGAEGRRRSIPFRYVWPSELDLMALIAGMELEYRWDGFRRDPFTAESRSHVSVWRLPADS